MLCELTGTAKRFLNGDKAFSVATWFHGEVEASFKKNKPFSKKC